MLPEKEAITIQKGYIVLINNKSALDKTELPGADL